MSKTAWVKSLNLSLNKVAQPPQLPKQKKIYFTQKTNLISKVVAKETNKKISPL